jgi:hypothetical protein
MPKPMLKQLVRKQHEQEEEEEEGRGLRAPALPCFATPRIRRDNQEGICL